jgi:hypothetical protein
MNDALEHLSLETVDKLTSAVVDTSSLIFANKAGFLLPMTQAISLTAPPGVLQELQEEISPELGLANIDTMPESTALYEGYTVDAQVVVTALRRGQPVVSDDYKLLQRAADQGIDGFTVRTMLELTLLRGKIDLEGYVRCKRSLSGLIRYALPLFLAAEELHWEIRKQIG